MDSLTHCLIKCLVVFMKNKNEKFTGIINIARNHTPRLWEIPFDNNYPHYPVSNDLIKKYRIVSGTRITCDIERGRINNIISLCGKNPEEFRNRSQFDKLTAVSPNERFNFSQSSLDSLKIIDRFTPLGKGSRALIVSPPRAGKTTLLENLANGIIKLDSKLRVIVMLIDERPEEITAFRMNTKAMVFHSSLDKGSKSHVILSSLLINHIKAEVESGNDIVLLIDSLTRLGRAYNNQDRYSAGRTLSGGLGANALETPRKLFGMARNIENGGSCTILATILKDTGSRMDEVIFQEFKGTGNSEIILDRDIADNRIYPAINIRESGTRKEELLLSEAEMTDNRRLRSEILKLDKGNAILRLKDLL